MTDGTDSGIVGSSSREVPEAGLPYDALLLVSFGGPERPEDVIPFLEDVLRGKNVPRARLSEVAEKYYLFGGVSPLNAQNRALLAALVDELNRHGPRLAVYWGNRYGQPLLETTVEEMAQSGVRRALAFVTSAFGSYTSCRQYLEAIEQARKTIGPEAPQIEKLRLFYNHPGFVEAQADRVMAALRQIPADRREAAKLIYTAHSIPLAMASKCAYEEQLREACRLVSEQVGREDWVLVYQSRSSGDCEPWLEPDIGDYLVRLHHAGKTSDVVIVPLGFVSENMEIVYDLDVEVASLCEHLGLHMVRAAVVSSHPRFITMIRQLILERIEAHPDRLAVGRFGPSPDVCPAECCLRF